MCWYDLLLKTYNFRSVHITLLAFSSSFTVNNTYKNHFAHFTATRTRYALVFSKVKQITTVSCYDTYKNLVWHKPTTFLTQDHMITQLKLHYFWNILLNIHSCKKVLLVRSSTLLHFFWICSNNSSNTNARDMYEVKNF